MMMRQVVCGDVHASGVAPHEFLIAKHDAKALNLRYGQAVRLEFVASSASSNAVFVLESVIDVSDTLLVAGQVQVHEWVCRMAGWKNTENNVVLDQVRLLPIDSSEEVNIHPVHTMRLSLIHKFPMNFLANSATNSTSLLGSTNRSQHQTNQTRLLPQCVRDHHVNLAKLMARQLCGRSQTLFVPHQLVPIEILGDTFVFQVKSMDPNLAGTSSLGRLTKHSIIRVQGIASDIEHEQEADQDPETMLTNSLERQYISENLHENDEEHQVAQRLWTFGFAGYHELVQELLFHLAVLFDPPAIANTSSSPLRLGCHGFLVSGPCGIGKSWLLKAIANEFQHSQQQKVNCIFVDALAFEVAVENSKCSTAYEFLLQQLSFEQADGNLDLSQRCLILVDDLDALFSLDPEAEEHESSPTSSASSSLGMAMIRFLDECQNQPNCRVGVLATCQNLTRIPTHAKRVGRLERLFEMIPPTEAMRTMILLRHLACFTLSSEHELEAPPPQQQVVPSMIRLKAPTVTLQAFEFANRLAKLMGGFVAKDLLRVCRHGLLQASCDHHKDPGSSPTKLQLRWQHLLRAKQLVKPGQLQSLNVESGGLFLQDQSSDNKPTVSGTGACRNQLIAGYHDVIARAKQFVQLRFNPSALADLGVHQNGSGLLLFGPSGCGKTALVREIASKVPVNFVQVKCAELLSKYFGESEQKVRDLFARARSASPCILFFDEFDSIAHKRAFGNSEVEDDAVGSSSVYTRILSTFLNEMDGVGVDSSNGTTTGGVPQQLQLQLQPQVMVIAATNRVDALDAALLRPGRIDKKLELTFPQVQDRHAILAFHTRKMPLAHDVDLDSLARKHYFGRQLAPLTGADLAAVCKEAALQALRDDVDAVQVTRQHFERAFLQKCR